MLKDDVDMLERLYSRLQEQRTTIKKPQCTKLKVEHPHATRSSIQPLPCITLTSGPLVLTLLERNEFQLRVSMR